MRDSQVFQYRSYGNHVSTYNSYFPFATTDPGLRKVVSYLNRLVVFCHCGLAPRPVFSGQQDTRFSQRTKCEMPSHTAKVEKVAVLPSCDIRCVLITCLHPPQHSLRTPESWAMTRFQRCWSNASTIATNNWLDFVLIAVFSAKPQTQGNCTNQGNMELLQ